MKKINLYIAGAALAALAAGCSEEQFTNGGEGSLALNTRLSTDVEVVSRASVDELAQSCEIWISSEKGLVRRYEGIGSVPASIDLLTGRYVAEAWAGDSVSASFEKRFFKGEQEFVIEAGKTTPVALTCKIANVVASVKYADNIEDVLTDYTMTVGHIRGSLDFVGRDSSKGYFMMPSYDKDLAYTLKGTAPDGKPFEFKGIIENAQPATEYVLNVKYESQANPTVGGAILTIVVDKHEIEVPNVIEIIAPPRFSGYGFDIDRDRILGEPGAIGRQTVYISSANTISSVVLRSDAFLSTIPALGGTDFDFLSEGLSQRIIEAVNNAGINFKRTLSDEGSLVQLNFEETYTNALPEGEYSFEITATDNTGKQSTATLSIIVTDASVAPLPALAEETTFDSVTFRGEVKKDGVETVGFNYRKAGTTEWTSVEASVASRAIAVGSVFTATVSGLEQGTTYEYAATTEGFVSSLTESVTTDTTPQLPNCGFEEWNTSGKAYLLCTNESSMFWDSGNHGSATMNKNVTVPESSIKHSGNYSVKLESQFVGIGALGKFAAGNLFIGKYLATQGTDGVLGWGRPFDFKYLPKAVKVWVKYTPATIVATEAKNHESVNEGDLDQGIIYMALTDNTDTGKTTYNGETWGTVVKTKASERQLFSRTDANVVAYGEHVFTQATDGSGLIEITIPLDYSKPGVVPTRVIMVASASRYGDYFCGGRGSVMYVDDIELVY